MSTDIMQVFISILVLVGSVFAFVAAIGIVRLPDIYTRMHAASKAGTVGSGVMLIALGIHSGDPAILIRSIVAVIFFLLTAPISAHLLARASYMAGYKLHDMSKIDEMSGKLN